MVAYTSSYIDSRVNKLFCKSKMYQHFVQLCIFVFCIFYYFFFFILTFKPSCVFGWELVVQYNNNLLTKKVSLRTKFARTFITNEFSHLGGKIELRISSVWCLLISLDTGGSLLPLGGVGTGLVFPSIGCVEAFSGRD